MYKTLFLQVLTITTVLMNAAGGTKPGMHTSGVLTTSKTPSTYGLTSQDAPCILKYKGSSDTL